MSSPTGFSRNTPSAVQQKAVAIQNVDLVGLKAYAYTREESGITIDLRYFVGAVHTIPSTGDQWIIRKYANTWILWSQLPINGTELNTVADNPVQGMVQIGSTNPNGTGPLHLNGSQININANFRLGTTLYRDNNGTLEYREQGSSTWIPVAAGGSVIINVDYADIINKPTTFPSDWDTTVDKPTTFPGDWDTLIHKPSTFPPTPPTGVPDGTKFWSDANTWAVPPGGGGGTTAGINIITGEVPSGSINNVNVVFTLANAYATGSTMVYLNGVRAELGFDYTETSGHTITFDSPPRAGDDLRVDYVIPGLILSFTAGEVPSGTKNGSNLIFTLSRTYLATTTSVFRNGLREQLGVGYTESSATTITFTTAPLSSDIVVVDYLAMC